MPLDDDAWWALLGFVAEYPAAGLALESTVRLLGLAEQPVRPAADAG